MPIDPYGGEVDKVFLQSHIRTDVSPAVELVRRLPGFALLTRQANLLRNISSDLHIIIGFRLRASLAKHFLVVATEYQYGYFHLHNLQHLTKKEP